MANPWSPTVQAMSGSDPGMTHDPEARSDHPRERSAHPTTAAAPSAKMALAISLSASLP